METDVPGGLRPAGITGPFLEGRRGKNAIACLVKWPCRIIGDPLSGIKRAHQGAPICRCQALTVVADRVLHRAHRLELADDVSRGEANKRDAAAGNKLTNQLGITSFAASAEAFRGLLNWSPMDCTDGPRADMQL